MSVLGTKKLNSLIKTKKLIENLNQRDKDRSEGAGFDLRVGKVFKIVKGSVLGIETRTRPELKQVAEYDEKGPEKFFTVKPGKCYVVQTVEKVNMPLNLAASVSPRHSLYGQGVLLGAGNVPPGYKGELAFSIFNSSDVTFKFALGSRAFFIEFREVTGGVNPYKGQWQGGNVKSVKNEKQI